MRLSHFVTLSCLLLASAQTAAAGKLKVTNTTFGWDPFSDSITTTGSTPLSQFPAILINQSIEIEFDENLKKGSVKDSTVRVQSVGAGVLAPLGLTSTLPGGVLAPVSVEVEGDLLRVRPAVFAIGTTLGFGFVPGAFYELILTGGKKGVKGGSGDTLKGNGLVIPFRVLDSIADTSSGPPTQKVLVLDFKKGSKKLSKTSPTNVVPSQNKVTAQPAPQIRIKFNEHVIPSTVLNPATGGSPAVIIEIDQDGVGSTPGDRQLVPGTFGLSHSQTSSTLTWTSKLKSFPGESLFVVRVLPTISDLNGNSVFTQTGDIGAITAFGFRTNKGTGDPLDPLVETFNGTTQLDASATSASWGKAVPGFLVPGFAGGTGADGSYPPQTILDQLADVNVPKPIIDILSTEVFDAGLGEFVPRIYEFTEMTVPNGLIVRAQGRFGFKVRSTGPVIIAGLVDVSGENGEVIASNQVLPGMGGAEGEGGSAGAIGGSITLGPPGFVPTTKNTGFGPAGYANSAAANQGLSFISSAVSDFTVTRNAGFGDPIPGGAVGLKMQPNTGTGVDLGSFPNASPGELINHNHPNFRIEGVAGDVVTVISDVNDPDFQGPLNQPGLDTFEFPPPPIAKPGDPVVYGDLSGHVGDDLGFAGSGGGASEGLATAQQFITQVRSGGGGGGGAREAGDPGEDSPPFGVSAGTLGGSGGVGCPTGTVASFTATTITAVGTPFAGLSLGAGANPDTDPAFVIFPDISTPYVFEIVSNTDSVIEIAPVPIDVASVADSSGDLVVDLTDVVSLSGASVWRVEPSLAKGGAGGGGSGVHLAGTPKFPPVPNLTLPIWTPGCGGGSGGGSVEIESGDKISLTNAGSILARGGDGGQSSGAIGSSASGGGGGGGGAVELRSADTSAFPITVNGKIDATGGSGGHGYVEGGRGGDGRVRLASTLGNLNPAAFPSPTVLPALTSTDLGVLLPQSQMSVARSDFYFTGALISQFTDFKVTYNATVNGTPMTGLVYDAAAFDAAEGAPFVITFNDAPMDPIGNVDAAAIDAVFVADPRTLSEAFLRFQIVLDPAPAIIGGATLEHVAIDTVEVTISG